MAPNRPSSSSAERPYHGANGRAVVAAKVPGTPRREQSYKQEKALQDPGLKDYVGLQLHWCPCSSPTPSLFPFWPPSASTFTVLFSPNRPGLLLRVNRVCTARPYIQICIPAGPTYASTIRPAAWRRLLLCLRETTAAGAEYEIGTSGELRLATHCPSGCGLFDL
jgi:hypothetical protein